jgi:hypothetical protein
VTWLTGESYFIGALILFSVLWIQIVRERGTESRDAGVAAA